MEEVSRPRPPLNVGAQATLVLSCTVLLGAGSSWVPPYPAVVPSAAL